MIRLLLTSGRGPAECRLALARALETMQADAAAANLDLDVIPGSAPDRHGPASVILRVGDGGEDFARQWIGVARWSVKSPLRPHHGRKNWFVEVVRLSDIAEPKPLCEAEVRFQALRAGGPGGQHQNTTDSAIRATHLPTGLSVVARDERSQHRNRAAALVRLAGALAERHELDRLAQARTDWAAKLEVRRGGPVHDI